MLTLTAGQRLKLSDLTSSPRLTVHIDVQGPSSEYDTSCFLLGADEKLISDDHVVFYNNPQSPDWAVQIAERSERAYQFKVDPGSLASNVKRMAFTCTLDDHRTFRDITRCTISLSAEGKTLATFTCNGLAFQQEKALILLEIYFKDVWRMGVVAQGFNGGLADLVKHFGGEVEAPASDFPASTTPIPAQPVSPAPRHVPAAQPASDPALLKPPSEKPQAKKLSPAPPSSKPVETPAPAGPSVNLKKVTLDKTTTVTLKKPARFTAKLIWDGAGDLDFYCFYVTQQGQLGKVYWKHRGNQKAAPFIRLDKDAAVNSKTKRAEETITVTQTSHLRYVMFAAYSAVLNGIGAFAKYKPHAVIEDGLGQEIRVPLRNKNTFSYWVAIAKVTFDEDGTYTIERIEKYSRWGSEQSPSLLKDGRVTMDSGPVEFKLFRK